MHLLFSPMPQFSASLYSTSTPASKNLWVQKATLSRSQQGWSYFCSWAGRQPGEKGHILHGCTSLNKELFLHPNNIGVPLQRHWLFSCELQNSPMCIFSIPHTRKLSNTWHWRSSTLFPGIMRAHLGLAVLASSLLLFVSLLNSLLASRNPNSSIHFEAPRCHGPLYSLSPPHQELLLWSSTGSCSSPFLLAQLFPRTCSFPNSSPHFSSTTDSVQKKNHNFSSVRSRCFSSLLSIPTSISSHHTEKYL